MKGRRLWGQADLVLNFALITYSLHVEGGYLPFQSFTFFICKTRPNNIYPFSVVVRIKCKFGDKATGQSLAPHQEW